MKTKAPFIFALVGVILGFVFSLIGFLQYFLFRNYYQGFFSEFFNASGMDFSAILTWMLISSIIGMILSLILIFYVVRLSREPDKKDCIVTLVLGSLGIFLGMGFGGILVVVGGITGIIHASDQGK